MSLNSDGVSLIAKQIDRANQDISGKMCKRNDACELVFLDNYKLKAWVEHYARLLNVIFDWPSETLPKTASIAEQPPELIYMALSKVWWQRHWAVWHCN